MRASRSASNRLFGEHYLATIGRVPPQSWRLSGELGARRTTTRRVPVQQGLGAPLEGYHARLEAELLAAANHCCRISGRRRRLRFASRTCAVF